MLPENFSPQRPLTYLALPYSHPDPAVRCARFVDANIAAAKLLKQGHLVYSPISHTHPIAAQENLELDWSAWESLNATYLALSHTLIVLTLDGWRDSVGLAAEIKLAKLLHLNVRFLPPEFLTDDLNYPARPNP